MSYYIELVPLDPSAHAEAMHLIFGDEASCRYLPSPAFATVTDTEKQLEEWADGPESISWAMADKASGEILGRVTFFINCPGVWEAGIMVVPHATGRGIARQGMALALKTFVPTFRPRRIIADIDPENTPSLALFRSLGFQQDGYLRAQWHTHIGIRDTVLMAWVEGDPAPWLTA
ncbi:GNAT family N-acetyltransferase [Parvularcula sp. LCG005]|uniref:GNAT family N-acetyltransferase n=1 Tax=Parvularcula sp. LCG005 TaxID=3078805 RepID=UPI00294249A8|nr:GNAT family N-acetyltransferase [Parvularcula sp. LCG005]WOI53204.1 GNAT family N-acetyltransferase [Parvularcula sp. LCG005]